MAFLSKDDRLYGKHFFEPTESIKTDYGLFDTKFSTVSVNLRFQSGASIQIFCISSDMLLGFVTRLCAIQTKLGCVILIDKFLLIVMVAYLCDDRFGNLVRCDRRPNNDLLALPLCLLFLLCAAVIR